MTESRRERPELTVLVFGVITTVMVTGALFYAGTLTERVRTHISGVQQEAANPLVSLNKAEAGFDESQASFDVAVAAPTAAQAGAGFSKALTEKSQADQEWARFVASPPRFEGEVEARQAVDAAIAGDAQAGEALGVAVLNPIRDPALIADLQSHQLVTHAELRSALRHLRAELYLPSLVRSLSDSDKAASSTSLALLVEATAVLVVGAALTLVGYRRASRIARASQREVARQHLVARENALDAELQHALDMTMNEPQVYGVIGRALATSEDPRPADFLLADSNLADFTHVVSPEESRGIGCSVPSPHECPVTRYGREQIFESSSSLDACSYLRERDAAPCAAVCMLVNVAGQPMGVIHERHPDGAPPPAHRIRELEIIARKSGERLSIFRTLASSEHQAHTDPLTGLFNRRSLQEAVARLNQADLPLSVAFADLDHFKVLNDTHGHDAGDRALRLFATVLRSSMRPNDIVSRYGGEEFVIVLPRCDATEAVAVLKRLQQTLADTLRTDTVPPFTVSIGVVSTTEPMPIDDLITLADGCVLRAKDLGRDQVVVAGSTTEAAASLTGAGGDGATQAGTPIEAASLE
jgi:diguanylate cyclase (GGDEF)-like protein